MTTFGLMLKSYGPDFDSAQRLVESVHRFNSESLPMVIVVPEEDVEVFSALAGERVTVMSEAPFAAHMVMDSVADLSPGYVNQQVIKLAFWELGTFDNYLVMDSDAVFIRPFRRCDFMFDEATPFTALTEDRDLMCDPVYYRDHWVGRERHLRRIQELVGLEDPRLLTCHNHQVFNSTVLRSLRDDFAASRGWAYRDLIALSPYEFSWYNFWLQRSRAIPIEVREPWFKMLHTQEQHTELGIRDLTLTDLARGYVGLVINGSFARTWGDARPDEPAEAILARYVSPAVLVRALAAQARQSARRRLGR